MISLLYQGTFDALRNYGLLEFFCISSMRQQINLLQYFLDAWDPMDQAV